MAPEQTPSYLDWKTLDRLRRLDVTARQIVEGFVNGQHRSPYHGFAVEFATHREYSPGDDLRHIDWKVWSKTDRLYIKEYEEETNLRCQLIVDCSKSMAYGKLPSKFDYACTAAACLAYLLTQQQDAVGLTTFHNKIVAQLPTSSHPNHLRQLIDTLQKTTLAETTTPDRVLADLAAHFRSRGIVALFSDLFVPLDRLKESLQQFLLRKQEVIVFHVLHSDELTFPFEKNTQFQGLETPVKLLTEPRALRKGYLEAVNRFLADVKKLCSTIGVDHVLLNTADPLDGVLGNYLAFRQKVRKRSGGRAKGGGA